MSKFHIETTKTIEIDGIKYKADINTYVNIDFSATTYRTEKREEKNKVIIDLYPDDMSILHKVTDIFPLEEYDIKVVQRVYNNRKYHISLNLDIVRKATNTKIFFAESAILSDEDYDYIKGILEKEYPEYAWQTKEDYLRTNIEQYLNDEPIDLFTDAAMHYLARMVSAQYKEMKSDGIVLFDDEKAIDTAKGILENALREAYDRQGNKMMKGKEREKA